MEAAEKTYNGWANYETWNVALWIGNEPGTEEYARELTASAWEDAEADSNFTREERAVMNLEDSLKGWVEEELIPDLGPSMAADLLGAALCEVHWHEIAENYMSDYDKPLEAE